MANSILDYSLADIARILGGKVYGTGSKRYVQAPAPGHSAADDSFTLEFGKKLDFVVKSHCGDDERKIKDYVREKLSLPAFEKTNGKHRAAKKVPLYDVKPLKPAPKSSDGLSPDERLDAAVGGTPSSGPLTPENVPGLKFVEAYLYKDASGKVVYQNCRYLKNNGAGKKTFRPWRLVNGKWIMSLGDIAKVPYHLDEIAEKYPDAPIIVCEGEKDADRVRKHGYVATNGADGWWEEIAKYFSNREVTILADFNKPGTERALRVATALHGTTLSTKMIFLPGLDGSDNNKDTSDWLDKSGNNETKFADICRHAPLWTPGAIVEGFAEAELVVSKEKESEPTKAKSWRDRFKLTKLYDITPSDEPLWLVDGLIPSGPSLGVIFGKPKSGKTFLTADMFLHPAMGHPYCGCVVQQGAVVYISKEGVRGFQHRMMAMREHHGAGPEIPFYVAHEMPNFGQSNGDAEYLALLIQKLIPSGQRVAAVILDTLARTMPGQSDSDPAAMSMFVENCNVIAEAFKCFVGAVHHSPRSDDTRSRGSNVLDGAADVIVSVTKDDATNISTAKIEDIKDSEEGLTWRFHITERRVQNGGFTPLCESLSNPHRAEATESKASPKLTPLEKRLHTILCDCITDCGELAPGAPDVPHGVKAVTREQLNKYAEEKGFLESKTPATFRGVLSKYLNQLAGKSKIGLTKTHAWLPKP